MLVGSREQRTAIVLVVSLVTVPAAAAHTDGCERATCDLYGTRVASTDRDVGWATSFFATVPEYGFADEDASGSIDPGETVYLDIGDLSTVDPGDLRLTERPGTTVQAGDGDVGASLAWIDGRPRHADPNGDGVYQVDEPIYLDVDADETVSIGDVRLTPTTSDRPGTLVQAGDPHVGTAYSFLDLEPRFVDLDADGIYDRGDAAYLDHAFAGSVVAGMVRLTGRPTALAVKPVAEAGALPGMSLRATLTDAVLGDGLSGERVAFFAGQSFLCSATTNATGVAACGGALDLALAAAHGDVSAVFEAHAPYRGSAGSAPVLAVPATG